MKKQEFMQDTLEQLRIRNFWPKKGHTNSRSFYVRIFVTFLFCSPYWIFLSAHLIVVLKDDLDIDVSDEISNLASLIGLHFMYIPFLMGQKNLENLFRKLVDFSDFGKPDKFDDMVKSLNLYSKLCSYYCFCTVVIYTCMRKLEVPECRRRNEEKGLHEICGLIVSWWLPFEVRDSFRASQILCSFQIVCVFFIFWAASPVSFSSIEVSSCIVLKIKHLKELLKVVFDDSDDEVKRRKLAHCIEYHKHIIRLHESFDNCYKYCNAAYIIMVGLVIGALLNQYINDQNFGALLHLSCWLLSSFMTCHAGQSVLSESEGIAYAAFESKWYKAPIALQKTLSIVIMRAQRPLYLHAGPVAILSYELFVTLVKASSSYFAILNQST